MNLWACVLRSCKRSWRSKRGTVSAPHTTYVRTYIHSLTNACGMSCYVLHTVRRSTPGLQSNRVLSCGTTKRDLPRVQACRLQHGCVSSRGSSHLPSPAHSLLTIGVLQSKGQHGVDFRSQHSTAQHSTAQHSTAHTAQHHKQFREAIHHTSTCSAHYYHDQRLHP